MVGGALSRVGGNLPEGEPVRGRISQEAKEPGANKPGGEIAKG